MTKTLEIKPIRTNADYERALKQLEQVWGAKAGSEIEDVLDVLTTLIEAYEEKHFPIDSPDPVEAILFRMEQQGLDRRDLEPLIGSRGRVSEVLEHKRPLSITMIRNIHDTLKIPAEVLISPSIAARKRAASKKPGRPMAARRARSSSATSRTSGSR